MVLVNWTLPPVAPPPLKDAGEDGRRVHRLAPDPHLEVEVRPGCAARPADRADLGPRGDDLTGPDVDAGQVKTTRLGPLKNSAGWRPTSRLRWRANHACRPSPIPTSPWSKPSGVRPRRRLSAPTAAALSQYRPKTRSPLAKPDGLKRTDGVLRYAPGGVRHRSHRLPLFWKRHLVGARVHRIARLWSTSALVWLCFRSGSGQP